jgi:hypothetical protein
VCTPTVAALVVATVINPDKLTVNSFDYSSATPVEGESLI